jgi:hypothetical protein
MLVPADGSGSRLNLGGAIMVVLSWMIFWGDRALRLGIGGVTGSWWSKQGFGLWLVAALELVIAGDHPTWLVPFLVANPAFFFPGGFSRGFLCSFSY